MADKHKDISLRNLEYFAMIDVVDNLYQQSKNNKNFKEFL